MILRIDDPRLSGTWRLIAATSGHLDHRPCVRSATLQLERLPDETVRYVLTYCSPSATRTRSGSIRPRPRWRRPRTWLNCPQWLLVTSIKGQIRLTTSGSVASVTSLGSILIDPGVLIVAREDVSDEAAWTTVLDDMGSLQLTPMSVRELSWRIKAPGTDPSRYTQDPVA